MPTVLGPNDDSRFCHQLLWWEELGGQILRRSWQVNRLSRDGDYELGLAVRDTGACARDGTFSGLLRRREADSVHTKARVSSGHV